MYKSFRVKNFRCFKDLQINDLGRVNLIAGKNNTGKTALMEAMYLLAGNRDSRTLLRRELTYRRFPREIELDSRSSATLSTIFNDFKTDSQIEMSASVTKPQGQSTDTASPAKLTISSIQDFGNVSDKLLIELIDRRYGDLYGDAEVLKLDSLSSDHHLYILLWKGRLEFSRFRPKNDFKATFLLARYPVSKSDTTDRFSKLQGVKEIQTLIEGLQIIEPRLEDLRVRTDDRDSSIDADIGLTRLVSMNDLGDGMNRMVDLILAMHEVPRGMIFIDEIENGLHHTFHKAVWKVINEISKKRTIQVFATTHSYEMIQAAHEAFKNDAPYEFRYHRLDRKSDDDIEAVTYNKYGMDAVAAFDFEYEVRG